MIGGKGNGKTGGGGDGVRPGIVIGGRGMIGAGGG